MNFIKNIFAIIIVASSYQMAIAQPGGGGLEAGEVEVIKEFDARLLDTEKLKVLPGLPPLDTASRKLNYTIPLKTVPIDYPDPSLRPIAIRKDKIDKGFRGFLKAGRRCWQCCRRSARILLWRPRPLKKKNLAGRHGGPAQNGAKQEKPRNNYLEIKEYMEN